MYNGINAAEVTEKLTEWIKEWFENNGKGCNAVLGISGGKDSSVCAALCARALGKDRVIGVLMPNGKQADINDSIQLCEHLGIRYVTINIEDAYNSEIRQLSVLKEEFGADITSVTIQNLPPRLRMATVYAVSQSMNGRVINTCNLSEDYIGYSTRYGDEAGDVALLRNLTVTEVLQVGDYLGLPQNLVHKAPSDGLCGKTDEDNIGFTYAVLDHYIRTGQCDDEQTKEKIDKRHNQNLFKLRMMDCFPN